MEVLQSLLLFLLLPPNPTTSPEPRGALEDGDAAVPAPGPAVSQDELTDFQVSPGAVSLPSSDPGGTEELGSAISSSLQYQWQAQRNCRVLLIPSAPNTPSKGSACSSPSCRSQAGRLLLLLGGISAVLAQLTQNCSAAQHLFILPSVHIVNGPCTPHIRRNSR